MGGSWINFLIILLAFGGPVLSWVFGRLKEQAEQKRMRAQLQRQRDEELRTGRSSGQEELPKLQKKADDRTSELQRLAERRQQQLRELRARQAQKQQNAAAAQAAPMPVPMPTNRRGPAQSPRGGTGAPQRPSATPAQIRRREAAAQRRSGGQPAGQGGPPSRVVRDVVDIQQAMREDAPETPAPVARQPQPRETERRPAKRSVHSRERPDTHVLGREVQSLLHGVKSRDPSKPSLAALYAVSEVLSPPVSLREQNRDGGVVL